MTVVFMWEWDNAKDDERFKKHMKISEEMVSFFKKMQEKDLCKISSWVDDTEHMIAWIEFKDIGAFGKMWTNKEYRNLIAKWRPNVDNLRVRLLYRSGSGAPRFET